MRLGQPFDDGGLADARLAHEDGVVLGTAREDLHDPLDLGLATDDRVELALGGELRQVASELVEQLGRLLALAPARPNLNRSRADARRGLTAFG